MKVRSRDYRKLERARKRYKKLLDATKGYTKELLLTDLYLKERARWFFKKYPKRVSYPTFPYNAKKYGYR